MTPEPAEYQPPDERVCRTREWTVPLTEVEYIVVRQRTYKGKVVDFAIMRYLAEDDGDDLQVGRLDCEHSMVHLHTLNGAGDDVGDPEVIRRLSANDGQDVVNALFGQCLERMMKAGWKGKRGS